MASISSLVTGDAVVCRINGNYASGRVFIKNNTKYLANNDYSFSDTPASTQEERCGYRLAFPLTSDAVTGVKKVTLAKLPYKTKDVLVQGRNKFKVLGRCGAIHFLSLENDFETADSTGFFTRKELDGMCATLDNENSSCGCEIEATEMTVQQISEALGRPVKVVRG